jgi:phosphoserine phosphatase
MRQKIPIALVYDFDGTLSPKNMQEFEFIPKIGMKAADFWDEVAKEAKRIDGDSILVYMGLMLEKAREKKIPVKRSDFQKFGKTIKLHDGVISWFDEINHFAEKHDVKLQHFILSSGLREIIEGTSIAKKFERIYASGFWYDHNEVARGPAVALNYTTKTQYLFRINKGSLDLWDHKIINSYVPHQKRPVPFSNMIFIGDGETDIPCFRLVKDQGGHAIAVYSPNKRGAKSQAANLIKQGRVNISLPANYSTDGMLSKYVKTLIEKISMEQAF